MGENPLDVGGLRSPRVIIVTLLTLVVTWAYFPAFAAIWSAWNSDPDYSHGFLVVPLALIFLWLSREKAPELSDRLDYAGFILIGTAGVLRFIAGRFYLPEIDAWSIPIWIAGVWWLVAGRKSLVWALPSIAFLWFAMPLPGTAAFALSIPLQKFAAVLSGVSLRMFGQPAIVEGTTILLNDEVLEVERACSGLRMFYGVTALCFATLIMTRPDWRRALILVASIIPIAVLVNVGRITIQGLVIASGVGEPIVGWSHDLAGAVVIPVAFAAFYGINLASAAIADSYVRDARRLLLRFGVSAAATILICLVGFFWYQFQADRALETLIAQAERKAEEDSPRESLEYFDQYLRARPEETSIKVRMAELAASVAQTPGDRLRAAELLRQAYEADSSRHDLGFGAVRFATSADSYPMALEVLQSLGTNVDDSEKTRVAILRSDVLFAYLNSEAGKRQQNYSWVDVVNALNATKEYTEASFRHKAALAIIYRLQFDAIKDALQIDEATSRLRSIKLIDEIVLSYPDEPAAWWARFNYLSQFEIEISQAEAARGLQRAFDLRESAPDTLRFSIELAMAERHFEVNRVDETTVEILASTMALSPADPRPLLLLADAARQLGFDERAVELLGKRAMSSDPPMPVAQLCYCQILAEKGEVDKAERFSNALREEVTDAENETASVFFLLGLALVDAAIEVEKRQVANAATLLQSAIEDTVGDDDVELNLPTARMLKLALGRLGSLSTTLGRHDTAYRAYARLDALTGKSQSVAERGISSALASGNLRAAEELSSKLTEDFPNLGSAWLLRTRVALQRQLVYPSKERDFTDADRFLKLAERRSAGMQALQELQIELLNASGRYEEALGILAKQSEEESTSPKHWRRKASTLFLSGDAEGALAATEPWEKAGGKRKDVYLFRIAALAALNRVDEVLPKIDQAIEDSAGDDRLELMLVSADVRKQTVGLKDCKKQLVQARTEFPQAIEPVIRLSNLAISTADWDSLAKLEPELRELVGDNDCQWRATRAIRLLAGDRNPQVLEEVKDCATFIVGNRPDLPIGHYLLAQYALLEGDVPMAAAELKTAWDRGVRSAENASMLLQVLEESGELEERRRVAKEAAGLAISSPALFDRLLNDLIQLGFGQQALRRATEWSEATPQIADVWSRLGLVYLAIAGKSGDSSEFDRDLLAKADEAFMNAIDRSPGERFRWEQALQSALLREDRERVRELLAEAASCEELMPIDEHLLLAQGNDAIGYTSDAMRNWLAVVNSATEHDDSEQAVDAMLRAASRFINKLPRLAIRSCKKALEADPESVAAKMILVRALGSLDSAEAANEALGILDQLPDESTSIREERLRLTPRLLFIRKRDGDFEEAIKILEANTNRTSGEDILLASLLQNTDRVTSAFALLESRINAVSASPGDYVAFLKLWQARFQQEDSFVGMAESALRRLKASRDGVLLGMRWDLRLAKTSPNEVQESNAVIVSEYFDSPIIKRAIEQGEPSTALFDEAMRVLIEEGLISEACDVCRDPPFDMKEIYAARVLANRVMRNYAADPTVTGKVLTYLDEVQTVADAADSDLLRDTADLAKVSGENDMAKQLYGHLLELEPDSIAASANLASLPTSGADDKESAIEKIEDRLNSERDQVGLLLEIGKLHLQMQKPSEARIVLQKAIEANNNSARACFYLAQLPEQDESERDGWLAAAVELGIEDAALTRYELEILLNLRAAAGI